MARVTTNFIMEMPIEVIISLENQMALEFTLGLMVLFSKGNSKMALNREEENGENFRKYREPLQTSTSDSMMAIKNVDKVNLNGLQAITTKVNT